MIHYYETRIPSSQPEMIKYVGKRAIEPPLFTDTEMLAKLDMRGRNNFKVWLKKRPPECRPAIVRVRGGLNEQAPPQDLFPNPISVGKSIAKAAGCEMYFDAYVRRRIMEIKGDPTQDGTDFHRYRQEYTQHLINTKQESDPQWVFSWLDATGISDGAREMVERDVNWFEIDPESVLGVEEFIVIDHDLKRIDGAEYPGPGMPAHEDALAHGTIDLLTVPVEDPDTVTVIDYKTGWGAKPDEYEGMHYAFLSLCAYPSINTVNFFWRLIRFNRTEVVTYHREDLPRLHAAVLAKYAQINNLRDRLRGGATPSVNPFSGMCGFCNLQCPVRQMAADGQFPVAPIQTDDDARAAAGYLHSIKHQVSRVEEMLRGHVKSHGPVTCPGGIEAGMRTSERREYPLRAVLGVLGVEVPEISPQFDVPLDKLLISATKLNQLSKAKSRAGLYEAAGSVAEVKLWQELKISESDDTATSQSD